MYGEKWDKALDAMKKYLLRVANSSNRAIIFSFSSPEDIFSFKIESMTAIDAIDFNKEIKFFDYTTSYGTFLEEAIKIIKVEAQGFEIKVVLISDGKGNVPDAQLAQFNSLRTGVNKLMLNTIGIVDSEYFEGKLKTMAEIGGGKYCGKNVDDIYGGIVEVMVYEPKPKS